MSEFNTEYLEKCIATLEKSYEMLKKTNKTRLNMNFIAIR